MRTTWNAGIWTVAATALLAATVAAAPAPPDTSPKEVMALNAITGEDAELGRIFQLLEDAPHTKSLLAEAAKLAKEKDQPLNVTAAYVLARTAQLLRDTDDAIVFYKLYIDQSVQLQSAQQIGKGYTGLIETYYDGGKYEDSEKACDEFLALKGDPALQQMKPTVLREMVLVLAKEGKIDKATELMDRLVKSNPDDPMNLIAKGTVLARDRQAGQGGKGLTRTPSTSPKRTRT